MTQDCTGIEHERKNNYCEAVASNCMPKKGPVCSIALRLEAIAIHYLVATTLEAIATGLEAIAIRLEAIAIRLPAIATGCLLLLG